MQRRGGGVMLLLVIVVAIAFLTYLLMPEMVYPWGG